MDNNQMLTDEQISDTYFREVRKQPAGDGIAFHVKYARAILSAAVGQAITVWKDGSWKQWSQGDAGYAQNDPDWLATIPIAAQSVDASDAVTGRPVTDEMVSRFLGWKLPQDFYPDCYVAFDREKASSPHASWPTGTNLLHAGQARAMLEHVLAAPAAPASNMADAYVGAREDISIWKRRALEAEELNRKFMREINGPTHMGEPVIAAPASTVQPVGVQDQLIEHQATEFEIYEFSDGTARIMKRSEFDQAHGRQLRMWLEQAREIRRLNSSQCDAYFKSSPTQGEQR